MRGTTKRGTGDSAVTRSMVSVHEVMISNDTRIYARSMRSTYLDMIGGRGDGPRIINSDIPSGQCHLRKPPPLAILTGKAMNIGAASVRSAYVSSNQLRGSNVYPRKIAERDLPHAVKFVVKVVAVVSLKFYVIGGKTRARVPRTRTGGLSKSTASLADFILITRGVDFASFSLCDRLQIMLKTERDKKLPSIRGNIFRIL